MKRLTLATTTATVAFLAALAAPAAAQAPATPGDTAGTTAASGDDQAATSDPMVRDGRPIGIRYFRPIDRRGINVFETTKEAGAEYTGFKLDWNAAFTTQVQDLSHENSAEPVIVNNVNTNQLADIGFGFNNSTANLYLNAQLARGIRVELTSYLSARHHNETWVKGGYLQIDESPFDVKALNRIMEVVTLKIGHYEINYGDAHFRRSDNGNAIYNPFVGNYLMDAFTTEIGAEVVAQHKGFLAVGAVTGGEVRGTVLTPGQRGPSYIGKLGVDRQVRPNLRVRLTGSVYHNGSAVNNTLYSGDRAGSRYYFVVENTAATETAQFTSGAINPGFRNEVTAMQFNPFVKYRGLEVFGVLERAEGKALTESATRTFNQRALDVVYRFAGDALQVGVRHNVVEGRLAGLTSDIEANRWQVGGGWFVTPSILLKAEYVNQTFDGYPATNIRRGGKFSGMMLEGVVAF